jgi:hypothetical protein
MPNKRNSKTKKSSARVRIPATLSDGPAYAGQQKVVLTLPGLSSKYSTTITTGVIASSLSLSTSRISNFATRFGSTFDEYRILSVLVKLRALSASTGISTFLFDEKDATAPDIDDANQRLGLRLPNTNAAGSILRAMRWRARDLLDLEYSPIGTVSTPVYFKVYTDASSFGAPVAVSDLWIAEFDFTIEFRGIKAV